MIRGNGSVHSAKSDGASGPISAYQPKASVSASVAAQNVVYVAKVAKGTASCSREPICGVCCERQYERSRTPGLVRTKYEPPKIAT